MKQSMSLMKCLVLLFLLCVPLRAFSVPAKPGLWKLLTLTDGKTVNAMLVGDEYAHYWVDADGNAYQSVNDDVYMQVDLQAVRQRGNARRSAANQHRTRRLVPRKVGDVEQGNLIGKKKGLIILVNFSDVAFQSANNNALFQRIANEKNFSYGNFKGSMYDYFYDQSEGLFELTFDVVGPVTVSKSQSYYGENDDEGHDKHAAEMVIEAVELADPLVNYADYDWDGDFLVDQVYVVYAGKGEADGGAASTIWPHQSNLLWLYFNGNIELETLLHDGMAISTYACGGELNGSGNIAGIGTMCHEFSHCLGFPDFYDTDYSGGQGLFEWDLMDMGNYNGDGYCPAGYTSYERWAAGWKEPIELTSSQEISGMAALQDYGSQTYVIYNKGNRDEYFLLENRQKTKWDAGLPGAGLLILHVDYDADIWESNKPNDDPEHQRMTWIPADNEYPSSYISQEKTYYRHEAVSNDPFPYGSVNAFGRNTTPAATLFNQNTDGTYYLDSSVEDITQNSDGTISFRFDSGTNTSSAINFADADVKKICVENWDTDGDGELSEAEAAAVTSLGQVFKENKDITSFDELRYFTGLTSIGPSAFSDCDGLTSITIPGSVTSIDVSAFNGCTGLTSVTIPNSVTSIDNWAFGKCSGLTSVTIPSSVTSIGKSAFSGCSGLTSVTIPKSVTSIGSNAFSGTAWYDNMPDGLVYAGNVAYKYKGTMPANTAIDIKEGTTGIADSAFSGYSSLTSVTIPNSVTSIGEYAFSGCTGLTSITIPNSVTSIGDRAFAGCGDLTSIKVEGGNSKYDSRGNCNAIIETATSTLIVGCRNTVIPNSVTSIGEFAFSGCTGLTSVTIPNSVISIGSYAFQGCSSLTSITIPNSVTSIGEFAFRNCTGLTSIKVETENTKYDSRNDCNAIIETATNTLIAGCKNTVIPNSVTSIGESAFSGCSGLTSITIPNSVTSIGDNAFLVCNSLTSVTIPNSVTSIGNNAFYGCSLTSVTIGSSVTSIGNRAFFSSGLTDVYCLAKNVPRTGNAFSFTFNNATLHVPASALYVYKATEPWSNFVTIVAIEINFADANVKKICVDNWDTDGDGELSEVEAAAVTSIGVVFQNKTSITSFDELRYFTGLTSIGSNAFNGCSKLTSIFIGKNVTSIGKDAFKGCSSLTKVIVPDIAAWCNTSFANNYANPLFYATHLFSDNGTEITELVIPEGVTSIQKYAFYNCNSLTSLLIPDNVTSIGDFAFLGCSSLASINIPSGVTSIGKSAFNSCSGMSKITISNSVTSIGDYAFSNCSGLTNVYCYAEKVPSTSSSAFNNTPISSASLHVPENSIDKYKAASPWSGFGTIVGGTSIINFADAEVKRICVENWDTDGDGELSEAEAAAVTSLGEVFEENRNITSFDELQYFTGLTSIGDYAFYDCSRLISITIPNSVTKIGNYAFCSCEYLPSITIPNSVTRIGSYAFSSCDLTSVTIPNSVTRIGKSAFESCYGLTSVIIGNSVTSIGDGVFAFCVGLTSVKVAEGNSTFDSRNDCNAIIETASNNLIAGCMNTTIPGSVTSIGDNAFYGCWGLTSIAIPNSVTSIGESSFARCERLTTITIPNSVISIGEGSFYGCRDLTSVTIPNSVTSIGSYTFALCSSLTDVYCFAGNVPSTSSDAFEGSYIGYATLHVPTISLEDYRTTEPWSSFGTIVAMTGRISINDEMASLNITTEESGCTVEFTHNFTSDWEALYLPFAIDYNVIKADFELAEIDGIVQNDDNGDGVADITVLSIMGFKEQMTEPNTPYLIRAKNAGEQTIVFDDVTVYPTEEATFDCSSFSTRYEFTGTYNTLGAENLAEKYVVHGSELVRDATSLAPCRWYMTAASRKGGTLNLPARIRIMPVEDVITGVSPLGETEEGAAIYNLAGQRMSKIQKKGIVIRGGKKIVLK